MRRSPVAGRRRRIHFHKSDLDELADLIAVAHANGLLAEAYVHRDLGETHPFSYMGLPAESPADVAAASGPSKRRAPTSWA
jgi:hypothetical protein